MAIFLLHPNYVSPPIDAIPVVKMYEVHIGEANGKWIEPEQQKVADGSDHWGRYYEAVPSPAGSFHDGYLMIDIRTLWGTHLLLECMAQLAYPLGHDIQFSSKVQIGSSVMLQEWMVAYRELKALSLEWLSYARVPVHHSKKLVSEDERVIMAKVAWLEDMKRSPSYPSYRDLRVSAREIARWCGWFHSPIIRCGGDEDMERVLPRLDSLVERGYLFMDASGNGNTYRSAGFPALAEFVKRNDKKSSD